MEWQVCPAPGRVCFNSFDLLRSSLYGVEGYFFLFTVLLYTGLSGDLVGFWLRVKIIGSRMGNVDE